MNDTVKRIVEILFQDTEMTEEATAIKDEIMNNCQERYSDLVARGMTEDEAIAEVVESLKGMEEVIGEFPKVKKEPEKRTNEAGESDLLFDPGQVSLVDVHMISEDVAFEGSMDDMIHVLYNQEELPYLRVYVQNGRLLVERDEVAARSSKPRKGYSGNLRVEINGDDVKVAGDSVTRIFKSLGDMVRINIRGCDDQVRVQLPGSWANAAVRCGTTNGNINLEEVNLAQLSIHTTNGDVEMTDASVRNVSVQTTSGNVTLTLEEGEVQKANVRTTSGDIELTVEKCAACSIQSMSGDVTLAGKYDELNISTVSGDVEAEGAFITVQGRTVSGDFSIDSQEDTLQSVNATTTSGDVEISVSDSSVSADVRTQTISGDVFNRLAYRGEPSVKINVKTVSGDITVE